MYAAYPVAEWVSCIQDPTDLAILIHTHCITYKRYNVDDTPGPKFSEDQISLTTHASKTNCDIIYKVIL